MLQSHHKSTQDTSSTQKAQNSSILSVGDQSVKKDRFHLDQRNFTMENPKKKWEKQQFRSWLVFIVQRYLNSPYVNIEDELHFSRCGDKIFEELQKNIGTKNRAQCFKFTRKLLRELSKHQNQGLVSWCFKKLKNMAQDEKIAQLLHKYQTFTKEKSAYMQILSKMSQFYDADELQSLRNKDE